MRFVLVIALLMTQVAVAQLRIIPEEQLRAVANPKMATTDICFLPTKVSFGEIDEMSGVWQGRAQIVNRSADTVVITRLQSTCGCFKATPSERVLAPQKGVEVLLKYYPRGHAGEVAQRVFVYTTLSEHQPSAVLHLEGLVVASSDRSDDYPYMRGPLRLRQEAVRFNRTRREGLRIACMNGGDAELRLSINAMFRPKGLNAYFSPAVLAPKQEGYIIIEYNPEEMDFERVKSLDGALKLYIDGIELPMRQRAIEVVIE